jgi:hypothetical protein
MNYRNAEVAGSISLIHGNKKNFTVDATTNSVKVLGISVAGLHHGELVCDFVQHILTKGHGVLHRFCGSLWKVRCSVLVVTTGIPLG